MAHTMNISHYHEIPMKIKLGTNRWTTYWLVQCPTCKRVFGSIGEATNAECK